jgi:succinoglycan biosynthesis protein ExoM
VTDPACDLTFSIATYDRPHLLARTLRCCAAQTNRRNLRLEILVTDNHPSGNGAAAVDDVAAETTMPLRYQRETARSMSVLRNAGLKAARGALIAIIDDDEFCGPEWLDALLDARDRTGADIVLGLRLAVFAAGAPPPYDPTGAMFVRDLHLKQDAIIDLVGADGRPAYGVGTGNSLLDAARCCADPEPFDRAFGNAGGEDVEFFMRLYRAGRVLVWAPDAVVTEIVPEHRTTVAYRLLRARRETQIYVSTHLHYADHKRRAWLVLAAKGAAQMMLGGCITLLTWEFGSTSRLRGRLLTAVGRAKLEHRRPVGYIDETSFDTAKPRALPLALP